MKRWKRFIRIWVQMFDPLHIMPKELRYGLAYTSLFMGFAVLLCVAIAIPVRIIWLILRATGLL